MIHICDLPLKYIIHIRKYFDRCLPTRVCLSWWTSDSPSRYIYSAYLSHSLLLCVLILCLYDVMYTGSIWQDLDDVWHAWLSRSVLVYIYKYMLCIISLHICEYTVYVCYIISLYMYVLYVYMQYSYNASYTLSYIHI